MRWPGPRGGGAHGGRAAPCCGGSWRCSVTRASFPEAAACSTPCAGAGGPACSAPGKGRGRGSAGSRRGPARPHPRPLCCRAECQEQVNRFPSASFKKFAIEEDAWAFVRAGLPGQQQQQPPEPAGSASCPRLQLPGRTGGRFPGKAGAEGGRAAHRHIPASCCMAPV